MPRFQQPLTVRSQILALMLAVVLPSAAAVAWALSAVLASEMAATEADIKASSLQVAGNLGLLLREREDLLVALSSLFAHQAATTETCDALHQAGLQLSADRVDLSERSALALRGRDGARLCGSGPDPLADLVHPGSAWFSQGLGAAGFVAGPVLPMAGGWVAPLSHPLHNDGGAVVGLLVLPLDLRALQRHLLPPALSAQSETVVSVIDGNDAVLMRSLDAAQWLGKPWPQPLSASMHGQRDAVLAGAGLDGKRRMFAIAGVENTRWQVIAGVPEERVLAHYRSLLVTSALAGGLSLALVLALAWRLGNRIVRPIAALAAVSARVAAGNLSARAEAAGPAEIAAVARQFNQMLDAGRDGQQALAASESQLRFLIEHLLTGVVVHAPDASVLLANARASELLGLSTAQLSGWVAADPAWRFVHEDGRPMTVAEYPVMQVITRRAPLIDFVGAIDRPATADRVWVIVNAYPQFHDDGSLRQVVVSFVDITARKKAEQTLVASEERYRMLFENSLDGVLQTRPDGSVLAANPAACAIFGLNEQALRQRGRAGLVDQADPRLAPLLARRAREGFAKGRTTMLRGDGSRFEAELASSLFTSAAGELLAGLVVRDLSAQLADEQDRARLELQLRESQKMEAIGTLAGGIAHDFNNLLGGLLGNATLAADSLGAEHPARAQLDQITRAGQRARSLVQQILAFSRRQAQPTAQPRQALKPVLAETLALLRATLPAGVQLQATVDDPAIEVACDATQIQQVLMNLCTNAWHALDGRPGQIGVRLGRVDFGPHDPARPIRLPAGPYAHLQVRDEGRGMDDGVRARIFEPFFTTKPVGQGTGLGLAVVHGIVAAHRGEISVYSQPGAGSQFDVYLPLADPAAAALTADTTAPAPAGSGQHVLCVDDDEVMLLMAGQLLERAGYRVTCLSRVAEALSALRQTPQAFDLVVTDFNMPDGSGLDVARAALQQRPDLPVVLSSGYLPEDLRQEALAAGVQALLMKEHTVDQLPALVARLLAPTA